jgi:poly(A) polymerase
MSGEGRAATIAGAEFLADPRLARLFVAIEGKDETAWVVGGAVRDALLGLSVGEVDVATTATPEVVTARAAAAGLKPVPTGVEHGTVTVVVDGRPFEVTTLRHDVETFGRRAVVAFGRDRMADALRRDFTMNALYARLDGTVEDLVGGVEDCRAGRVRFIGDADRRIAEDRLRILRFFRFHATRGRGALDGEGFSAAIRARDGLLDLSAERIARETEKLVVAPGAPAVVATMSDAGLLQRILGRAADLAGFARLHDFAAAVPIARDAAAVPLFLAGLACWTEVDALDLAARLRLAHAVRDRMAAAVAAARRVPAEIGEVDLLGLLDRVGRAAGGDALALAVARRRTDAATGARALARLDGLEAPVLPVGGRDLLALGLSPGPQTGRVLAELRAVWCASGFRSERFELLARARKIIDQTRADPPSGV